MPTPAPSPPLPAPRPVVSFARMLVLAQRRFRQQQQGHAAALPA
ncbi:MULTISPECIES: hypothetical protein [unclassified Roseateles]|nr:MULTISPECIES: hypothetical protein [unclassified Roseateles]